MASPSSIYEPTIDKVVRVFDGWYVEVAKIDPDSPFSDIGVFVGECCVPLGASAKEVSNWIKKTWHENIDHKGTVRIVRPETNNGIKTHYVFDEQGNFLGKR